MKTNVTKPKVGKAMNTKNIKTKSVATESNLSAVLDQDLFTECTYGLEYIIDEIYPKGEVNVSRNATMNWAGFDDLMI